MEVLPPPQGTVEGQGQWAEAMTGKGGAFSGLQKLGALSWKNENRGHYLEKKGKGGKEKGKRRGGGGFLAKSPTKDQRGRRNNKTKSQQKN